MADAPKSRTFHEWLVQQARQMKANLDWVTPLLEVKA